MVDNDNYGVRREIHLRAGQAKLKVEVEAVVYLAHICFILLFVLEDDRALCMLGCMEDLVFVDFQKWNDQFNNKPKDL